MKNILIVLSVICVQVALGKSKEEDLPVSHTECLKELNIAADVLLTNTHDDFSVTENNSDFNKIILCVFRKGNYLNSDDTMDDVKMQKFLADHFMEVLGIKVDNPEETAVNATEACKTVLGSDPGDTVVKKYNCILKQLRKS